MSLVIPDCGWSELEDRLLGPACDRSGLQTNRSWLGRMKEHFRVSGIDYDEVVDLLTDKAVLSDVKKIGEIILSGKWVVLKCVRSGRVDAIRKTIPVVYSLTARRKSFISTTDEMISLFRQPWKRDEDSVVQHESVGHIEEMKTGGLLFWEKINAVVPGGTKFSGFFDAMLKGYARSGGAVVATMVHWKSRPERDKLLGDIAMAVGDVVAYYFTNYAKFLNVGD